MKASRAPQMFITSLRLHHWRNFRGPVDLRLRRRAFLIGPNASGKSNVLDALRFLRDTAGHGLKQAVRLRGGMGEIRTLQARTPAGLRVAVDVGTDDAPRLWTYSLRFRNHPKKHLPEVMEEEVHKQGNLILRRPDAADKKDSERLAQTYLEQIVVNQDFRELAEFLKSIRYLHIVPHLVRDPERSIGRHDDPFGGDFLEKVASTPAKTRDARLRNINKALKIAIPQFDSLTLQQDAGGRWHLEARFSHWRQSAARQYERSFSDGTLRLIGLLWSLAEGGGPLLLEEPELALHDALVRHLPRFMARMHTKSGRQVLITTHSAALLADVGIGLDEVHVLAPDSQGTEIKVGKSYPDVRAMVEKEGLSIGAALLPKAAPAHADQFSFDF